MATQGAIRAGKAFVELFTKDASLRKGLDAARKRLNSFGKFAAGIGAKVFAGGAAILAPLTAAVFKFASAGDQLNKMSVRAGASVESLSQLGFAAEQSGSNIETLGSAMFRMRRRIANATTETGPAVRALKALGLSADELSKLDADQQLLKIADSLSQVDDDSLAAQYAFEILGNGAKELLPLLKSGSDGIKEMMSEARDLGLSISDEQAQAAADFSDAWNRIKRTLGATVLVVGGQLAPALTSISAHVANGAKALNEWVQQNKGLVTQIAIGGVALLAAGSAFLALGGMAIFAGMAIGGLTTMMALAGTVIGAVLSPVGLLTAAVIGGAGALLYYTGVGGRAVAWIKDQFSGLGGTVSKVFAAIKNAMAAGDYKKAAEILWLGIKVAFLAGTNQLLAKVGEWKTYFLNIWYGTIDDASKYFIDSWAMLQRAWVSITQFFGDAWDTVINGIKKTWSAVGGFIIDGAFRIMKALNPIMSTLQMDKMARLKVSVKRATGVDADSSELDKARDAKIAKRGEAAEQNLRDIENTRNGANQAVDGDAQRRTANHEQAEADSQKKHDDELKAAQTALAEAMRDASNQLSDSAEKTQNGETKTEKAAKAANAPGGSFKEASQSVSGGNGDLKTQEGIESIANLLNIGGEDTTLEDQLKELRLIKAALQGQRIKVARV